MNDFMQLYNLTNLVKEPTCFKNPDKPTCIDLILTNFPRSFQYTTTIEIGLSDFHKMTVMVLKTLFKKTPPKIIYYRDYRHFSNNIFRQDLTSQIPKISISDYDGFHDLVMSTLNNHAPKKTRYVRANQAPFMNKSLH